MAFLLNRLKASNAPKTEDPRYDEANAIFKGHAIEAGQFRIRVEKLIKLLKDLSRAYVKFSTDLGSWLGEGANPAVVESSGQLASVAQMLDAQLNDQFGPRVDPNFLDPLFAWEREVSEVNKVRSTRMEACQAFDRDRELQRLAETAKKPKQAEIDKARAKTEDSHGKYERANAEFIEAVNKLNDKRSASVADPFKHMFAISCQFIDAMAGCASVDVATAALSVPAPVPADAEGPPASQGVTQPPASSPSQPAPESPSPAAPPIQPQLAAPAPASRGGTPFDDDEKFERGGWADEEAVTFRPPPAPKIDQRNPFANPFDDGGGNDDFANWGSQYDPGHRKSTGEGDEYANPFD